MIKEVPVVVPEQRYTDKIRCCDICGEKCRPAEYYSTCDLCHKDVCDTHAVYRPDLVESDKYGEYPPVCTECSKANPTATEQVMKFLNRCMELKVDIEKQNPSSEVWEVLAHLTAIKNILDKE